MFPKFLNSKVNLSKITILNSQNRGRTPPNVHQINLRGQKMIDGRGTK